MGKKVIYIILLLVLAVTPSHAVLKERDITSTLAILRQELTAYHAELERQSGYMRDQQQAVRAQVMEVLNKSQQNAIMLYSQRSGNIFDLTYACHEATEEYRKFRHNAAPFREMIEEANIEVNRYDSLINDLSQMYVQALNAKAKVDRNVCLTLAINIRRTLSYNRSQMQQYIQMYERTESYLKNLNDYANLRYADIQQTIFSNSDADYFTILRNIGSEIRSTSEAVKEKYKPITKASSDWDSRIIVGLLVVLIVGGIVAVVLNYILVGFIFTQLVKRDKLDFIFDRFITKKEGHNSKTAFQAKRTCIILATTVITFALILGIVRMTWEQNFIIMASGLLVEYAWLMGVVLFSLLIRLDGDQIRNGFRIYSPIMVMCFVVITFRIILIPNALVTLVFPPALMGCAIWQWYVIGKFNKRVPKSDMFYSYISLAVFIASVVASAIGYTLLSVELLIWWTMQLTCILTITCISSMLKTYGNNENRAFFASKTPVTRAWFFRFLYYAVVPILGAISVIVAIYWAADVFNLSDTTWQIFRTRLIDSKNFTFSIFGAVQVIILYFVFSYINHTAMDMLTYQFWQLEQEHAREDKRIPDMQNVNSRTAMWKNVIQVVVWGAWILISMGIFNINNTWLLAISGGLSTGVGFAMKDILENIYYGISLMAGRIKVGDYISIDGTRGTVRSISYTSTMLEAGDGSVIAYQNSQLFTQNYKNLTKNHGKELVVVVVGVAYGSNMAEVRQVLADAVKACNKRNYIEYADTRLDNFGDNSIDIKVLAWVDSRRMGTAKSEIMEAIYNALNEHNIEIPFPQRDLHIVSDNTREAKSAD